MPGSRIASRSLYVNHLIGPGLLCLGLRLVPVNSYTHCIRSRCKREMPARQGLCAGAEAAESMQGEELKGKP